MWRRHYVGQLEQPNVLNTNVQQMYVTGRAICRMATKVITTSDQIRLGPTI
jgi:hypothetical protein